MTRKATTSSRFVGCAECVKERPQLAGLWDLRESPPTCWILGHKILCAEHAEEAIKSGLKPVILTLEEGGADS